MGKIILSKAYKLLGLIHRSFSSNGAIVTRRKLYISLIHSQVLYCSQVWRPFLTKHINLLERIQRQTTKWILNDYHTPYRTRLQLLQLMYAQINDILLFIKSYKHPSLCFNISEFVQFSTCNTRFGSSQKMIHHKCSSNMAQNFYFHRLPRLWNFFPKIDLSLPIK